MDLLSNIDESQWKNDDPKNVQGLVDYTVLKSTLLEPGKFQFALKENKDDGVLTAGVLTGAQGKNNPLKAAHNVEMKLDAGQIVAINLDGDCVVRK